jgi:hypothetical protein
MGLDLHGARRPSRFGPTGSDTEEMYKAKDELVHRKIVPESTYKQFSDDVVAHHSQTKKK